MKKNKKAKILVVSIMLFITAFTGCSMLEGVIASPDIILRIETFQAALNSPVRDAVLIAANFAPAPTTAMADQVRTNVFWDDQFDSDYKYDFSVGSIFNVAAVEATMTTTLKSTDTEENDIDVKFKMFKDDAGNWLIEEYYEDGTNVIKLIDFK